MALEDYKFQLKRFESGNNIFNSKESFRINNIVENYLLFSGEQANVYLNDFLSRLELAGLRNSWITKDKEGLSIETKLSWESESVRNKYMTVLQGVNTLGGVTRLYSNLIMNEGVKISDNDEARNKWLNGEGVNDKSGFLSRSNFNLKIHTGITSGQVRGDYLVKLWQNGENAEISIVSAVNWIPLVFIEDKNRVKADALVEKYSLTDEEAKVLNCYTQGENKEILKVVVYEKGFNYYGAFTSEKNKIIKQVAWNSNILGELPEGVNQEEEGYIGWYTEDTGLDYPMLFRIPNKLSDNSVYGVSDYTQAIKTQQREICVRSTQVGRILDKNSDPMMYGSKRNLDTAQDGSKIFNANGQFLITEDGGSTPGFLTWTGDLESNFKAIDYAKNFIYEELGVNPAIMGTTQDGLKVISGKGVERIMMRSLSEVNNKKMINEPILEDILRCAYQIETGNNELEPNLNWDNGIPRSKEERVSLIKQLVGSDVQLKAIKTGMMELFDISEKEAMKELEIINSQNVETGNDIKDTE